MDLEPTQIYPIVPSEVLLQVMSYLDAGSISSCLRVSRFFYQVIEEKLWKILFFRDFTHFLYQMPLDDNELAWPQDENEIQMLRKQSQDFSGMVEEPNESLSNIQAQIKREASIQLRNWKGYYILCYMKIDLNGCWIGDYGRHGKELIRIHQKGYEVTAIKITGDENVPAGHVTWKMNLNGNLNKGKGFMQLAEIGYKNPAWVTSYLNVIDKNSIQITWFIYDPFGNWYSLTFGTIRAGTDQFDQKVLEREVKMLTFDQRPICK